MDFFGIGSAVRGALEIYFRSARGTGRTTALLNAVKDGDRVVFLHIQEANEFRRLCREQGKDVIALVCPLKDMSRLFERGSPSGDCKTIFDHSFLEALYRHRVDEIEREINGLQVALSGRGAKHEETRLAAKEAAQWRV